MFFCGLYQNAAVCVNIMAVRKINKCQSGWVTVLLALLYSNLFHSILLYQNAASMYDYTVPNSKTTAKTHSEESSSHGLIQVLSKHFEGGAEKTCNKKP